ncbi:MAG: PAS domain-containing protein [Parvibaculum sp.]
MHLGSTGFRDPRLERLYAYWLKKKAGRLAPVRADLDPAEIKHFLPILNLLDVRREPLGFRHRLVGTEIVDRLGRDATGHWVDAALYGPAAPRVFDGLRLIVEEGRPYKRLARLDWHTRNWLGMEAVEMPLVDEAGEINMILRGASYFTAASAPFTAHCVALPHAA